MGIEIVSLVVAGYEYRSWTAFGVSYGAKKATPAFTCAVTDDVNNAIADVWNYMPGTACMVKANGDLVLTGFTHTCNPSFDKDNHTVNITGSSKSSDSSRAAADHPTGEMRNMTPLQIAQALDKQGVGFTSDADMTSIPLFRVNPGETVLDAVSRACSKQDGLSLMGQPDGSIKIAKGGTSRVHPALQEGTIGFLGGSATFSDEDQHSEIKVKGQKVYGTDKGSLQVVQSTKNDSVKRNIPKHVIPEADTDETQAKGRSKKHKERQQSKSVTASIKMQGWHDANGKLWVPNTLVTIYSPTLKLYQDLLLDSVRLAHGANGSTSQLEFVQPDTAGSNTSTGSKSDPIWNSPS